MATRCTRCGCVRAKGQRHSTAYCGLCLEWNRNYARARRALHKKAGLCLRCKSHAADGKVHCQQCHDNLLSWQKARRQRVREEAWEMVFVPTCGGADVPH